MLLSIFEIDRKAYGMFLLTVRSCIPKACVKISLSGALISAVTKGLTFEKSTVRKVDSKIPLS
jgi:hypothetical protein